MPSATSTLGKCWKNVLEADKPGHQENCWWKIFLSFFFSVRQLECLPRGVWKQQKQMKHWHRDGAKANMSGINHWEPEKQNQVLFQRKGRPRHPQGGSEVSFVKWIKGYLVNGYVFTAQNDCAKNPGTTASLTLMGAVQRLHPLSSWCLPSFEDKRMTIRLCGQIVCSLFQDGKQNVEQPAWLTTDPPVQLPAMCLGDPALPGVTSSISVSGEVWRGRDTQYGEWRHSGVSGQWPVIRQDPWTDAHQHCQPWCSLIIQHLQSKCGPQNQRRKSASNPHSLAMSRVFQNHLRIEG